MKFLLRRREFPIVVMVFLSTLMLLTLPISYAMWREILGVSADADMGGRPTMISTLPTVIQTSTSATSVISASSAQAVTSAPIASQTPAPSLDISSYTATLVLSTNIPSTDFLPTNSPAIDPPPTETPTELPAETSTSSG